MENLYTITIQFQNQTLPKEQWTHKAHFAVAFVYLEKFKTVQDTLPKMRGSIKSYNEYVGTTNTDTSGYHETLTVFWLTVLNEYNVFKNLNDISLTYREFIQTIFANAEFPLKFYSKELLLSKSARKTWIEPDLAPLIELKNYFIKENC